MIDVRIQADAFDAGAELSRLYALGGGGVSSFTGIVRADIAASTAVSAIEIEHYPAMTQAALVQLGEQACARWELLGAIIIHRIGYLPVGEPVVFIGTAASHRAAAMDACAYVIDRLKTDAPFWKKEHHGDGSAHWVDAKQSDDAAGARWGD